MLPRCVLTLLKPALQGGIFFRQEWVFRTKTAFQSSDKNCTR